ncbi:toprim domain-containing protein [Salinicola halophilus]|uniref:toprim domain-containing protein n=1 Tax=Salinicola halophilus TaxID=184065 RepID=UPI000DA10A0B|nr:toprim domain-containing protein [Salinicola halophilus]
MSEVIAKIQRVSRASLAHAETLTREWLPQGSRQGSEWVARNVARGDRASGSFGVSLVSGKWNDFADRSAHGGDLVSLYSYLHGCRQVDAAMAIDRRLGLGVFRWGAAPAAAQPTPSLASEAAHRQRLEAHAAERENARQEAASRAQAAWAAAKPAPSTHPYLMSRGVPAYGLRQCRRGWLLVPLLAGGELVNLQWITPNGKKRFLKGGQVQGAHAALGEPVAGGRLFVCEGWATGATLYRLTGDPVVCAMNAGNLRAVAETMRGVLNGSLDLVIAGDDDRQTAGNPGRQAANDAALAVGAMVLYPKWPEGCPDDLTDFNDLYRWHRARLDEAARADSGQAGSVGGGHE